MSVDKHGFVMEFRPTRWWYLRGFFARLIGRGYFSIKVWDDRVKCEGLNGADYFTIGIPDPE